MSHAGQHARWLAVVRRLAGTVDGGEPGQRWQGYCRLRRPIAEPISAQLYAGGNAARSGDGRRRPRSRSGAGGGTIDVHVLTAVAGAFRATGSPGGAGGELSRLAVDDGALRLPGADTLRGSACRRKL